MNQYELILLFDSAMGEDKIGLILGKVEDKIKALGGEVSKTEKWGTRKLASMVRKAKNLTQAYYVLVRFNAPSGLPASLNGYLKVSEHIVRHFISRAVELPPAEERIEGRPLEAVNVGEISLPEADSSATQKGAGIG